MRRHVAPLAALALVLGASACGSDDPADTAAPETSAEPQTTAPEQEPVTEPEAAPEPETGTATEPPPSVPDELDFSAPTVGGGTFDGASLAGQPAVVWFWAPWCPVCQREAPVVADLAERFDGQVTFVGVAGLSGDLASMESFIADGGVDGIAHIDDRDGDVYTRFGVTQQYDIGFVSADGSVDVVTGPLDEDELVARVEELAAG